MRRAVAIARSARQAAGAVQGATATAAEPRMEPRMLFRRDPGLRSLRYASGPACLGYVGTGDSLGAGLRHFSADFGFPPPQAVRRWLFACKSPKTGRSEESP